MKVTDITPNRGQTEQRVRFAGYGRVSTKSDEQERQSCDRGQRGVRQGAGIAQIAEERRMPNGKISIVRQTAMPRLRRHVPQAKVER